MPNQKKTILQRLWVRGGYMVATGFFFGLGLHGCYRIVFLGFGVYGCHWICFFVLFVFFVFG